MSSTPYKFEIVKDEDYVVEVNTGSTVFTIEVGTVTPGSSDLEQRLNELESRLDSFHPTLSSEKW